MAVPAEEQEFIKGAKILMVGAGGIGCELLKTLALTGFKDVHIIDMDTIEVSNLNRQFLFRKTHVGQPKAKVARDAVLKFRPDMNIKAYHANVKDTEFNVDFFRQFNVVLNGLDNLDARRHVNRLCLAAGVPLVESGTTGYLGQVTVHVKGLTECYECQPKPAPKTYPVCTITNTPSKFVHCVVWAKELLFAKLFGDRSQATDFGAQTSDATTGAPEGNSDVFDMQEGQDLETYGKRIFDHVFGYNIDAALKKEDMWKKRRPPTPLYIKDIFPLQESCLNGESYVKCVNSAQSLSAMASLGLKNPQEIWNVLDNARVFLKALRICFEERKMDIGNLVFDKDDQLAVEFVTAAANIRASSFGIPMQSFFDTKGIAGNIIHAIATTNAIIAGLIVIEAMKLLQKDSQNYRMTYCLEHPSRRMLLMPVEPFEPNKSCYVCSQTPLSLEVNTKGTKLRDVIEKVIKNKLGVSSPLIMDGCKLLFETGDDLEKDLIEGYMKNLEKTLAELIDASKKNLILEVEDLQQEFSCNIHINHRENFDEESDGFILSGMVPKMEDDSGRSAEVVKETATTPTEPNANNDQDGPTVVERNESNLTKRKRDTDVETHVGVYRDKKASSGISVNSGVYISLDEEDSGSSGGSLLNSDQSLGNSQGNRKFDMNTDLDGDDDVILIDGNPPKKTKLS